MINEQVMSLGDWDLTLAPDTPREVLDKITAFSEVVIMPDLMDAVDMDDTLMQFSLFRGTVFRPGPQRKIGGHGPACWLGTGNRYYTTNLGGFDMPYYNVISQTGSTLTAWAASVTSDTPITLGTVTDPTAGAQLTAQSVQWISHRELLDSLCKIYEVEWRINNKLELSIGPYTSLYNSPTTIITPSAAGRENGLVGIKSLLETEHDMWDYASQLYLLSQSSVAYGGSYSSFYAPDGKRLWVTALVDGADVQLNATSFAASRLITTLNSPTAQQVVKCSSDLFDIAKMTAIPSGGRVLIWAPEQGIYDPQYANQVEWRGETIWPQYFRCLGLRWPVRAGMGVLLRRYTGDTSIDLTGTLEWVDLTPYVEFEDGDAEMTIAYDRPLSWRP